MAVTIPTGDPRTSGSSFMPELRQAFTDLNTGAWLTSNAAWTVSDVLSGEATGKHLSFGYDATNSISYIRSVNSGTAFTDLNLAGLKTSLWSASGTADVVQTLTATGGSVGIGTSSPAAKLSVAVDATGADPVVAVFGSSTTPGRRLNVGYESTANYGYIQATESGVGYKNLALNPNGANVGVGTATPGASTKLNVAGRGLFTGGAPNPFDGTAAGIALGFDTANQYAWIQGVQTGVVVKPLILQPMGGGNVGIGTTTPAALFTVGADQFQVASSGAVTQPRTVNNMYANTGARVNRFNDVSLFGGATQSDRTFPFPSANPDWMEAQLSASYNGGAGAVAYHLLAQTAMLTDDRIKQSQIALGVAASSAAQVNNGDIVVGFSVQAINNNAPGIETPIWGMYLEAIKTNHTSGETTGIELEVRNSGETPVWIDPYHSFEPKMVTGLQIGVGCGQSATGQFNAAAGLYFFPNPKQLEVGILFNSGTVAANGPGGTIPGITWARNYEIQWYSATNTIGGALTVDTNNAMLLKATNVIVGTGTIGTSGAKVLGIVNGTDPTTLPSGISQMWTHNMVTDIAGSIFGEPTGTYTPSLGSQAWIWAKGFRVKCHTSIGDLAFVDQSTNGSDYPAIALNVRETYTGNFSATDPATGFSIAKRVGIFSFIKTTATGALGASDEVYGTRSFVNEVSGTVSHLGPFYAGTSEMSWGGSASHAKIRGHYSLLLKYGSGNSDWGISHFGLFETQSGSTGTMTIADVCFSQMNLAGGTAVTDGFGYRAKLSISNSATAVTNFKHFRVTAPVISAGTVALLVGYSVADLSGVTGVTDAYNFHSEGVNADNRFEGAVMLGGPKLLSDTAVGVGIVRSQDAYPQASTNTAGAPLAISGGTGRRLFTVVSTGAGTATVTITVNGTAVNLVSGTDFLYGASTTTAATNLAAAINANSTLNTKIVALASSANVYLTPKAPCWSLAIATNLSGAISVTSGSDGIVTIMGQMKFGGEGAFRWTMYRGDGDPTWGMQTDLTGTTVNDGFSIGMDRSTSDMYFNQRENANIYWYINGSERVRWTAAGNVKIAGSAVRGTTEGSAHIDIFNGTAPVGTLTNGISLYSASGELRVMDSAGNSTLLSPHDSEGNWIHDEVNFKGRRLRVDMERMLKAVDQLLGGGFIEEYTQTIN